MESQQFTPIPIHMNFLLSGLGGILGWIAIHPMNTLSVRMNLASATTSSRTPNFFQFSRQVVARDGLKALYSGLGAGISRQVFYATSRLGLYDVLRDKAMSLRDGKLDFLTRMAVGVTSGVCAAAISNPAEFCLVRMSNDLALPPETRRNYRHLGDAFLRIFREEGPLVFWRGSQAFMARAGIVGASQVGMNDQLQSLFLGWGVPAGLPLVASASMTAGLVYSIASNPFETAKNRMAFQKPDATGKLPYTGPFQTILAVAKADGFAALWNGFLPYYLRSGGHTVLMFICIDLLRDFYRKVNSKKQNHSKNP